MSHQQVIDQWVTNMLAAEARLRGLQLDLLDQRKDGHINADDVRPLAPTASALRPEPI